MPQHEARSLNAQPAVGVLDGALAIHDVLVKDYPILIRLRD